MQGNFIACCYASMLQLTRTISVLPSRLALLATHIYMGTRPSIPTRLVYVANLTTLLISSTYRWHGSLKIRLSTLLMICLA